MIYTKILGIKVQKKGVDTSKIDSIFLTMYIIIIIKVSIQKTYKREQFFQKSFLLANINMGILLSLLFLFFSNANL